VDTVIAVPYPAVTVPESWNVGGIMPLDNLIFQSLATGSWSRILLSDHLPHARCRQMIFYNALETWKGTETG